MKKTAWLNNVVSYNAHRLWGVFNRKALKRSVKQQAPENRNFIDREEFNTLVSERIGGGVSTPCCKVWKR